MLTSRNIRDAESGEMLDLIFQNRVFDMAFYFADTFSFYNLFKNDVYKNTTNFSSNYISAKKSFPSQLRRVMRKLSK